MALSSSALFHFTGSFENLLNVLRREFLPHFSLEDHSLLLGPDMASAETGSATDLEIAYPMVCFCDIPLSQTADHTRKYGSYGIGLTKEWGMARGLTPVIYSSEQSAVIRSLHKLFDGIALGIHGESGIAPEFREDIFRIQCFIKPYIGRYWRHGTWCGRVQFYDEREWRYVPDVAVDIPLRFLTAREFNDPETRERANAEVQRHYRIPFAPSDIRYIIVSNEDEILPLVRALEDIKRKYSYDDVRLLSTRVITAEQIRADF